MRPIEELKIANYLVVKGRLPGTPEEAEMYHGWVKWQGFEGSVIWGYRENGLMEHVSVSHHKRKILPTWDDMCRLKDIFFRPDEMVVQIHPAADRYLHGVVDRGNILHLWRPISGDWAILNHPERWD